ncbi:UNVERIFIED_CONTAM: putative peptidase [Acetivibrio alkalicellulosi]
MSKKSVLAILVLFTMSLMLMQYGNADAKRNSLLCRGRTKFKTSVKTENIISDSMKVLKKNGIKDNTDGMLLLKRYEYYMSEILKGNIFSSYKPYIVPAVYNMAAFSETIHNGTIQKIVENTLKGKDAFDGITGLFERAYKSEIDGKIDSYIIYVPSGYDPSKEYPLVVMLHGMGEMAYLSPFSPAHGAYLNSCEKNGVIMVAPCGRHGNPGSETFYQNDGEKDVLQVINLVKKAYNINKNKVYLTGYSMGGYGTWYLGTKHSDLFAAIAPVAGYGMCTEELIWSLEYYYSNREVFPEPPVIDYDAMKIDISSLKDVPVLITHGNMDYVIPVQEALEFVRHLNEKGYEVVYNELEGVGHNAADFAYGDDSLNEWFLKYSK